LEDTENELSVWRPDTVLSRFNGTPIGQAFQLRKQVFALFEEVVFWWRETGRTFDPAIGRLLQSRGFYGKSTATPSGSVTIGMQHIVLNREALEIDREADVWIDSGAFGKGEGLDRVRQFAESEGADPWLIDLGGQIMVYGLPPGKSSWTVDIAHPQRRDTAAMKLELKSGSLSTTGNSEQPGHVLDPRTGSPIDFDGSVIVWHERALVADIISTALFVMGPEKGIEWANARGIAACFLVPSGNRLNLRVTKAFANLFEIQADTI
jgi:thiamine biosynthesis lipoprotein